MKEMIISKMCFFFVQKNKWFNKLLSNKDLTIGLSSNTQNILDKADPLISVKEHEDRYVLMDS